LKQRYICKRTLKANPEVNGAGLFKPTHSKLKLMKNQLNLQQLQPLIQKKKLPKMIDIVQRKASIEQLKSSISSGRSSHVKKAYKMLDGYDEKEDGSLMIVKSLGEEAKTPVKQKLPFNEDLRSSLHQEEMINQTLDPVAPPNQFITQIPQANFL
jgi:hypothetical protein